MPSSSDSAPSFTQTIRVEADDIDFMGHVNNTVYLRWAQEVATAHWQLRASEEDQANLLWVVSRHEIDYKHPALLGDEVRLKTWVGSVTGITFERYTEISRPRNEQILAIARTLWIPINRQTKRPQRISPELRVLFSAPPQDS